MRPNFGKRSVRFLGNLLRGPYSPPNVRLFFLHVPKCGGTSIDHAMRRCFAPESRFHPESCFRLDSQASVRGAELAGRPLHEYRRDLLLYLMGSPKVRYISGHFWYSDGVYEEFANEWQFVTVLREPVSRWFSHYFFNKHKRLDCWRIHESLGEFLDTEEARLYGRFYSYSLGGAHAEDAASYGPKQAIEVLERFAVVGILEELGSFCKQMRDRYGLALEVPVRNTNPVAKPQRDREISDEVRERVRELCQPDIEVYEYFRRRAEANGVAPQRAASR